jgi:hypothetical protein
MGAFLKLAASQMTMRGMLKDGSCCSIDQETMEKALGPSRLRRSKDMPQLARRDRNVTRREPCFFDAATHNVFLLAFAGGCSGHKERVHECGMRCFLVVLRLSRNNSPSQFTSKNSSLLRSNFLISSCSQFPLFIVSARSLSSQCDVDALK